jgi:phage terminase large subunit
MLVVFACQSKRRILCARELQKSIKESSHKLIADSIERMGMSDQFDVGESFIRHKYNGSDFIFKGLRHNPDEIKSTEGINIAWVEEAHKITKESLDLLIPTVRQENSELWFTFNPDDELDEIYQMFIMREPPPNSIVVNINWDDNPWFPKVLDQERLFMQSTDETAYNHVWNGKCKLVKEGSFYGEQIKRAREEGRITSVPYDANIGVSTWWDLGVRDATVIWFTQAVGREIRVIDCYKSNDVGLPHYANVLNSKGYSYESHNAPHDIAVREIGTGKSRIEIAKSLGINFKIVPNLPVKDGIAAVSGILSRCYFDKTKCAEGVESLRQYRREWDDKRKVYKPTPYHDEHSDFADAFRYMAIGFKDKKVATNKGYRASISWQL